MSVISTWLSNALSFLRRSRDEHLHWQIELHQQASDFRQAKAMAEQALAAQLRKQAQQLAHELAVNKAQNNNTLAMVKVQCKQDLQDYRDYLQSLDKLKASMRASYANLPEAVAYTIHHHAKQLLNKMWDAQDSQEKIKFEMQLLQFMTAVHEDNQASLQGNSAEALPQRALAFIDADSR